ncbi:MAG: DegT/DnrJ/EryC1/StrS family aminotransferase [Pirellulales bacterium]
MMHYQRLYLSPPHRSGREEAYLAEALASNWLAPAGPCLDRFEETFARQVDVNHALAVSSGTAALHLALRHLELRPGDEVVCSTLTFCASANPIVYEGARPIFIDSDRPSWNMNPNLLEEELAACAARGTMPRAVVVVDIFGQSADIDAISEIAARYDIPVIEDAAEALGATYRGRPAGSSAWASVFSLNGNKIITASGGGVLCSNDPHLIERSRFLATQARDPAPHYQHSTIGYNYRMSNLLAGVGLAQLEVLADRVAARRRIFETYRRLLERVPGIAWMPEASYGRSTRWLSVILVDAAQLGATPEQIRLELQRRNIEARPVWKPLHRQPAYAGCRCRHGEVADAIFSAGLCLPSGSAMTEADVERVVDGIKSLATGRHRAPAIRLAA